MEKNIMLHGLCRKIKTTSQTRNNIKCLLKIRNCNGLNLINPHLVFKDKCKNNHIKNFFRRLKTPKKFKNKD